MLGAAAYAPLTDTAHPTVGTTVNPALEESDRLGRYGLRRTLRASSFVPFRVHFPDGLEAPLGTALPHRVVSVGDRPALPDATAATHADATGDYVLHTDAGIFIVQPHVRTPRIGGSAPAPAPMPAPVSVPGAEAAVARAAADGHADASEELRSLGSARIGTASR